MFAIINCSIELAVAESSRVPCYDPSSVRERENIGINNGGAVSMAIILLFPATVRPLQWRVY
jgi:hypothetical protein